MAGKARVTLMDIASAAGVSATTVSNVANGRLELMSAATRVRVEAAIRELNYRPNEGARNLRLSQSGAIGLIIVDESPRFLADPMTSNIVAGMSNHLSANGYEPTDIASATLATKLDGDVDYGLSTTELLGKVAPGVPLTIVGLS